MTARAPRPETTFTFEGIYGALRNQARQYLRREQIAWSMSPTVLVHEAWLSLARSSALQINDRVHYFSLVSRVMRNLLIDHARQKRALCRGGALQRLDLDESPAVCYEDCDAILAIAASRERLAAQSPSLATLVDLRFFSGFTEREVAQIMGISIRTVRRQWQVARLRLLKSLEGGHVNG